MRLAYGVVDRIDAFGRGVPLTAAIPLAGLYLLTMTLYALGFEASGGLVLVVAPAWHRAKVGVTLPGNSRRRPAPARPEACSRDSENAGQRLAHARRKA